MKCKDEVNNLLKVINEELFILETKVNVIEKQEYLKRLGIISKKITAIKELISQNE
jgi:hypothetical protein